MRILVWFARREGGHSSSFLPAYALPADRKRVVAERGNGSRCICSPASHMHAHMCAGSGQKNGWLPRLAFSSLPR